MRGFSFCLDSCLVVSSINHEGQNTMKRIIIFTSLTAIFWASAADATEPQSEIPRGDSLISEPALSTSKTGTAPLVLDALALVANLNSSIGGVPECKTVLDGFSEAITRANEEADIPRAKLRDAVLGKLDEMLEKAQSGGNLEKTLALKSARESFLRGSTWDALPELAKLREAYGKKLVQIDKELADKGLAAAKAMIAALEGQKTDLTKKGDLEAAKAIADFQKELVEWAKTIRNQTTTTQTATKSKTPSSTRQLPREVKSPLPEARVVTIDATNDRGKSIGRAKAGDVIELQYVSGKWCQNRRDPLENPDVDSRKQLLIVEDADDDETVTRVPRGTKDNPFRHTVENDADITLRMDDNPCSDNAGAVKYRVRIIPADQIPNREQDNRDSDSILNTPAMKADNDETMSVAQRIRSKAQEQSRIQEFSAGEDNRGRAKLSLPENRGKAILKNGETEFVTYWSPCGGDSVYAYKDCVKLFGFNEKCHSLPTSVTSFEKGWDFSTRCRGISAGQVFALVNEDNRFCAIKVVSVRDKSRGATKDEIVIEFKIY